MCAGQSCRSSLIRIAARGLLDAAKDLLFEANLSREIATNYRRRLPTHRGCNLSGKGIHPTCKIMEFEQSRTGSELLMSRSIREMKEAAIPFESAAVQKTLVDSPCGRTFQSRNWIRATHPLMSPVPCLEGRDRRVPVLSGLVLFPDGGYSLSSCRISGGRKRFGTRTRKA